MTDPYAAFLESIQRLVPTLPTAAWDYLQPYLRAVTYARKDHCLSFGQRQTGLQFVATGLVRGYYINEKGEEVTIRFAAENGYVVDYSALLQGKLSHYAFQCLEPTTVVQLPYTAVKEGYDHFPAFERLGRRIAENVLIAQQRRLEQFQFGSAEERYLAFLEEHPQLFNRISLTHLSTYLGIQRPSLSRIRQKIARS